MAEYTVTVIRTLTQSQEFTVSAKDEDGAFEKAEARVKEGLPESEWSIDEWSIDESDIQVEDVSKE